MADPHNTPPDLLAIGHVTRDLVGDHVVAGGAVTYGALTARALGLTAAIVTSARPGDLEHMPGVAARVVPSPATTTFRNAYRDGRRVQTIEAVAGPIAPGDVPVEWRPAPHVLIGPLAGEIDPAVARLFPGSVVVAALQGWLRSWDSDRVVSPRPWDGSDVLPHVVAAVVSSEDTGDPAAIDRWASTSPPSSSSPSAIARRKRSTPRAHGTTYPHSRPARSTPPALATYSPQPTPSASARPAPPSSPPASHPPPPASQSAATPPPQSPPAPKSTASSGRSRHHTVIPAEAGIQRGRAGRSPRTHTLATANRKRHPPRHTGESRYPEGPGGALPHAPIPSLLRIESATHPVIPEKSLPRT